MKNLSVVLLPLCMLLFIAPMAIGQESGPSEWSGPEKNTATFQVNVQDSLAIWREQIVLHTDKQQILPKDHLFFKAYVLTGQKQRRVSASEVLKVELLDTDGKLIAAQQHPIANGMSQGSFQIPKRTKKGDYIFRVYTRWMQNYGPEHFAIQSVRIGNPEPEATPQTEVSYSIGVFPEGGQLVAGLENRVAVAIQDDVQSLTVVDQYDAVVVQVKDFEVGFGTFLLNPKERQQYHLVINDSHRIALPEVHDVGYTMQVNTLMDEVINARITASEKLRENAVKLRGVVNGIPQFETEITFKDGIAEVDIPKKSIPTGVMNLEVQDGFGQVWAKRPVVIDREALQIVARKEKDNKGGQELVFKVRDTEGKPVQTEVSVAVTATVEEMTKQASVFTNERNARFANDLLLLTQQATQRQGLSEVEIPEKIKYDFQNGLEFYGQAFDFDGSLLTDTPMQIYISDGKDVVIEDLRTNDEGLFKLSNLQFSGEVGMHFRTSGEETRERLVRVVPYAYDVPPISESTQNDGQKRTTKNKLAKKSALAFETENEENLIALEEVTLTEQKTERYYQPSFYGIQPSRVVYQDFDRPKTIPQMFLNIPGVRVLRMGDINPEIVLGRVAGLGPILWVIDGFPLPQPAALIDIISLVPATDVERIELLFGPNASMYGTRAAGGAILIYTRSGSNQNYLARKDAQLTFQGYHESLGFDEYRLPKSLQAKSAEKTLYWNPVLRTDANGEARVALPEWDSEATVTIDAKVITAEGKTANLQQTIDRLE
ncbi:TonB-dependent receptor plug domain-containing protein [Flagellimonas sp. DF-77]|uniref:TonB-dependent receptor n=1 Tax=Flagellimonas algarum TaxID=3230298 RepID=UPI003394882D